MPMLGWGFMNDRELCIENTFSLKLFTFSFLPKAGGYAVMQFEEGANSEW